MHYFCTFPALFHFYPLLTLTHFYLPCRHSQLDAMPMLDTTNSLQIIKLCNNSFCTINCVIYTDAEFIGNNLQCIITISII